MRRLSPFGAAAGLILLAGAASGGAPPASAQVAMGSAPATASAGDILLAEGFARAMPPGPRNGGGYVTITNRGREPDRLIALSSPSSRAVEVHEMAMDGGTMQMRPLPAPLEIPPGDTVRLQPRGDMHLMFVGVSQPFAQGSEVTVTLTFEKAGAIALKLPVLAASATVAAGDVPTPGK